MQTVFVRAKEVLGGVGEQTTRELLQRTLSLPDAAPADLGRALLAEQAGRGHERGGVGGRRGGDGVGAAGTPGAAFAGGGAGRVAFGGGARARRGAAPMVARQQPLALVVEDAHFVDETALDAIEYATLKEAALSDLGVRRRAAGVRPRPHRLGQPRGEAPVS